MPLAEARGLTRVLTEEVTWKQASSEDETIG
jgi:hypothetical protein